MATLAEFDAARKGQASPTGGAAPNGAPLDTNSVMHGAPLRPRHEFDGQSMETEDTDPEGRFLSLTKDPSRYLGHVAKGLVQSPLDLVKNFVGAVSHPFDALQGTAKTIAGAIKHPIDTLSWLNGHPDEVGSLAGQVALGEAAPGAANTALAEGPSIVGRGMSAVGKGAEAAGTSKILKRAQALAPIEAATGHIGPAIASAVMPPALEYGGKLLKKGGAALEGLDLAFRDRTPPLVAEVTPVDAMREKVAGAREDVSAGFSRPVASKLNGLKSSATDISQPTAEVANPGELFPYQRDAIQGLKEARNSWANDASARPEVIDPEAQSVRDQTGGAYEPSLGLDSRITGLSPLDELSRMSGRAKVGADVEELLKKFGGRGQP